MDLSVPASKRELFLTLLKKCRWDRLPRCCFLSPQLQPFPSWSFVPCFGSHRPCSSLCGFVVHFRQLDLPLIYNTEWTCQQQIISPSMYRHNNTLSSLLPPAVRFDCQNFHKPRSFTLSACDCDQFDSL